MKESLDYIDLIKEMKMKRIKNAIPPIFTKVSSVVEKFDIPKERLDG
jgi:hypothetical protein